MAPPQIKPVDGKLGVLLPGMGAVATTFYAGVIAARKGLTKPIGSLTQMGHIRLGKRTEDRQPMIKDFVPLASMDDIVFGGWDPISDDAYTAAKRAGVLEDRDLDPIKDELSAIKPMTAVFSNDWVKKLEVNHVKTGESKYDLAEQLRADIRRFKEENDLDRVVIVWCASTEAYRELTDVHQTAAKFEQGLKDDDEHISPSQIYAWAAMMENIPFANGAPNLSVDVPAIIELSHERGVPIAGKDFKTGQTLMKTILAPGFKARLQNKVLHPLLTVPLLVAPGELHGKNH